MHFKGFYMDTASNNKNFRDNETVKNQLAFVTHNIFRLQLNHVKMKTFKTN